MWLCHKTLITNLIIVTFVTMIQTVANQQLSKFIAYCREQGIANIQFIRTCVGEYCHQTGTITLNSRRHPESQLYILLHEYGHYCITRDKTLSKKFAALFDREPKSTLSEQMLSLEEEVLAWHLGEQAAANTGICIDQKKFQVLKARCLRSYIASYKKLARPA